MPYPPEYALAGYWLDGYVELVDYPAWYVDTGYWASGYAVDDEVVQLNAELQKVAPSAIIELFQLQLNALQHGINETHYFHAGVNANNNGAVVWNGQAYQPFPIEATDFEYNGTGLLPRPKLRVSNLLGTITALISTLPNGIEGAKVTRIRTMARFIDGVNFPGGVNPYGTPDPTAEFPREIYYINRKVSENRDAIEFELASAFDLVGVRPGRQCVSNVCQWEYRSAQCGYTGNAYFNFNDQPVSSPAQDICGKRLSSCEARFAQQRIGGYISLGSNIISMFQGVSFGSGDPVSGFGIPAGSTVVSTSGALVTVSQNATASSFATSTGTITSDGTQIVLSSASGIAPGMIVTGSYLPANSQVVAVAGNTVTLSSPVPLEQFFAAAWTRTSAAFLFRGPRNRIYFTDLSTPMAAGQFIGSSVMPLSRRAVITGVLNGFFGSAKTGVSQYKIAVISQAVASNASVSWTAYTLGTIPAATYNFAVSNSTYTFRANASIPYGSFPGVGTYFS
jgi:lambda family phage minor tail protein L